MLKRWKRGDKLKSNRLNEPVDFINEQLGGVDAAKQAQASPLKKLRLQRFRVKSVQGEFLTCRTWDGTTEGENDVYVAKPSLLRDTITSRNGISYTYATETERTANNGSDTETQVVVPSFIANDEIVAIGRSATGVLDETVDTNPVVWLDLNLDSRAWAKKAE